MRETSRRRRVDVEQELKDLQDNAAVQLELERESQRNFAVLTEQMSELRAAVISLNNNRSSGNAPHGSVAARLRRLELSEQKRQKYEVELLATAFVCSDCV